MERSMGKKYVSTLKFFYILGLSMLYAYNIFLYFQVYFR